MQELVYRRSLGYPVDPEKLQHEVANGLGGELDFTNGLADSAESLAVVQNDELAADYMVLLQEIGRRMDNPNPTREQREEFVLLRAEETLFASFLMMRETVETNPNDTLDMLAALEGRHANAVATIIGKAMQADNETRGIILPGASTRRDEFAVLTESAQELSRGPADVAQQVRAFIGETIVTPLTETIVIAAPAVTRDPAFAGAISL